MTSIAHIGSTARIGLLALDFGYRLKLDVLRSGAGWYIGTSSPEDGPVTRESIEYFPSRESAQKALDSGEFTQRDHV